MDTDYDLTEEAKDALVKALETTLDTRDKRYMFLQIQFRKLLPLINIEGSPRTTAWNIYSEFDKQNMLGSLISCMNCSFDTDLHLLLNKYHKK